MFIQKDDLIQLLQNIPRTVVAQQMTSVTIFNLVTMAKKELTQLEKELIKEVNRLKKIIEDLQQPKQDKSKNVELVGLVGLYKSNGLSYQKIADKLNMDGYTNSRNNQFNKMQIKRLYDLYLKEQASLLTAKKKR